ncbi:hypothetical protein IQ247_10160 [Plectonema cf. radiosum LEGE 06105]|uniref:Uncharacterized protein n=1 Tax=Plectonema cf. radiosum LEGE 06105 TaxID=945769 RepID=A0A8J7F319_9CYAN|nr:hypothetical protein [Plectonema radiosum]MBE9213033.1 hypothetical protein [Plectonema cf. radiosum LEGE 06105]
MADVLAQAIALSFSPVSPVSAPTDSLEIPSIASLSDEKVVAIAQLQMEPKQDQRLSELLYRQQAEILTDAEQLKEAVTTKIIYG